MKYLLEEPQPGGSYGFKHEEIAEQIMPAALKDLLSEFSNNNYTTYPIGFIKHVKLSEDKQERMAEILSEITGNDKERILQEVAGNYARRFRQLYLSNRRGWYAAGRQWRLYHKFG